jgi:hypothetical protein
LDKNSIISPGGADVSLEDNRQYRTSTTPADCQPDENQDVTPHTIGQTKGTGKRQEPLRFMPASKDKMGWDEEGNNNN